MAGCWFRERPQIPLSRLPSPWSVSGSPRLPFADGDVTLNDRLAVRGSKGRPVRAREPGEPTGAETSHDPRSRTEHPETIQMSYKTPIADAGQVKRIAPS